MSKLKFRDADQSPQRTYTGHKYASYRSYKKFLVKDFKNKCGYTNCYDAWFGGVKTFQIDHFKAKSLYPLLETEYSNLVYCCSYVNRAKSNLDTPMLDPCDDDYNEYFYRNLDGAIQPIDGSDIASRMYKDLKLYLIRYSLIWRLERLEESMLKLKILIRATKSQDAIDLMAEVSMKYDDYKRYLRANM